MDSNLIVSVQHEQRGQPRSYAPHTYRSVLEFTAKTRWDLPHEITIKRLIEALVHPFTEEPAVPGSMDSHFQPRLTQYECLLKEGEAPWISPEARRAVYRVEVQEPYCD